ncbi:hypothetical protein FAGKG844_700017 [Frankia sp. AgKG'84/4]
MRCGTISRLAASHELLESKQADVIRIRIRTRTQTRVRPPVRRERSSAEILVTIYYQLRCRRIEATPRSSGRAVLDGTLVGPRLAGGVRGAGLGAAREVLS